MKRTVMMALAGGGLLALPNSVLAQEGASAPAQAEDGLATGDIIVTARRRDEDVQDVPLVVNAVTAEQIQKLNVRDVTEVQTLVPGLQLRNEANGIGGSAQIRGIQFDINAGAQASVAFYQNEAPVEASLVLQTMYDVGQVTVERGPQGTLRGQSAPSGAITITTRKPDLHEIGGYVTGTANNIGTINVNGALGVPVIPGVLALRVAGALDTQELNRVRTIERDGDFRDPYARTASGRVSVLATPAEWLRLEGVYQRLDRKARFFDQYESFSLANPAAGVSNPVIRASDRLSIQETPRVVDQKFDIFNWRAELSFAKQKLIYQGQHSKSEVHTITNQDLANFLNGRDFNQDTRLRATQTSHEVRLQNDERVLGMFDYVLGYFHYESLPITNLTQQTPVLLPAAFGGGLATIANTPITVGRNGPITSESFFGNVTAHLGASTELSGGLRHIKFNDPGGFLSIAGNPTPTPGGTDKGWVYVASVKHAFTPDVMVYAMTGTSRRPRLNAIGDFSASKSPLQTSFQFLPPESSRSYEIGFKSSWFDRRLRFNLTAFHQTFKNYPFRTSSGVYYVNYTTTVSNGATTITPGVGNFNFVAPVPVETNGVEAEVSFDVTPRWNVGILASYALGRIKNGLVACNDLNADGVPDNLTTPPTLGVLQPIVGANNLSSCRVSQRSSLQAPFSATVQSEYSRALSPHADGFVRGLFSFYGPSQGDPAFAYDQAGSFGLLNLFAGIRDPQGAWEISLFGKNIFNKTEVLSRQLPATTNYQRLSTSFVPSAQTFTSDYSIITTTQPREFGLNVRFAFGSR